jgi:hypothetical protein
MTADAAGGALVLVSAAQSVERAEKAPIREAHHHPSRARRVIILDFIGFRSLIKTAGRS